jgi:Rieske Fe-S protein
MSTTRREFCTHACQAASLAAAGALWTGCGGGGDSGNPAGPSGPNPPAAPGTALTAVSSSVAGRTVSITLAGTSLANVGGVATTGNSLGTFLISQPGPDTFVVLTATCTHEACTINGFANSRYLCPCHGSQYSADGNVVQGPAVQSLQQFPSSVTDGVLSFTA